ncbi:hypothetical protein [Mesorhizobium sp. INR15]|uniref:hypothetical protein n=1 Tax=Mesorhizobium sp. INR15 TaxID=2654248 RepID=UPI00189669E6|nr:hypothetical protein [Mesorhizobium sp. INR15]QPC91317.1 hypothetical protein GA829_12265 [Mesorhizobium sp. INR15]
MGRIVRSASDDDQDEQGYFRQEGEIGKGSLHAGKAALDGGGGSSGGGKSGGKSKAGDGYLDRVAKYVPAEIVAFFIFVNSILDNATEKPVAAALAGNSADIPAAVKAAIMGVTMAGISVWTVSWTVLIIALLMTPIYLKSMSDSDDKAEAPGTNIVMSMLAFPFWAYAVDALAFRPWHDGALASVMLATFTVISGAIRPGFLAGMSKKKPPGHGKK